MSLRQPPSSFLSTALIMNARLDRFKAGLAGISILEILLVVSILAIIASLAIPAYGMFRRKAEDAVCMSNLRSLHAGFSSYLQDHAFVWPQNPYANKPDSETQGDETDPEAKWWYEQLKDYGPTRETWLCPSERAGFVEDNDPNHFDMSYVPTSFDETQNRAYFWANQPWLIERGGFHDQGLANLVMPDGSMRKDKSPVPSK